VAETWPDELRAKAISVVQSSWAIGYALRHWWPESCSNTPTGAWFSLWVFFLP